MSSRLATHAAWSCHVVSAGATTFLRENAWSFIPIAVVAQPLAFAVVTLGLAGSAPHLAESSVIGAGALAMWTCTLGAAAVGIWIERRAGRFALVACSPAPTVLTAVGAVVGAAILSLLGTFLALFAAPLAFGEVLEGLVTPPAIVGLVAVWAGILALAVPLVPLFGAWDGGATWFNALIYPPAVICGFFVPVQRLPAAIEPLAHALTPYWGMVVFRHALDGTGRLAAALGWLAGLSSIYMLVTIVLDRWVDRRLRRRGSISID